MSVHLVECASELELDERVTATHKLALLCFADSGSAETRIARPGLETLLRWTGAKRSWALEVVNDLIEWQLLARHRRAYRGQRAEYVVFPNGCCERHGKVPADVRTVEPVEAVETPSGKGSALPDPLISSTGSAVSADPIGGMGPPDRAGMGPPDAPERVRSPRSKLEPSKYLPPRTTSPSGTETQPLTSRDAPVLDFTRMDAPTQGVRIAPPAGGRALGCRHCDAGWICDLDGLPLERCPHCHPAIRSNGASA